MQTPDFSRRSDIFPPGFVATIEGSGAKFSFSDRYQAQEEVDNPSVRPNHASMNEITRPELDAKLETIEARMDGRVAAIQASLDGYASRMEERTLRTDDRFKRIEDSLQGTQSAISNLKSTTIVTAIGAALTIVLGVAAFNATVLSNMVASFESGKNTSMAQQEVKRQSEETAALLKQIQQQMGTSPKPAQPTTATK